MLNARLIDFCFHLHPDWTFGAIAKFAGELFKIRNLFKENLVIEEIIGLADGLPIRLKRVGGESAIVYTLEHNGVVWLINDNVAGIPNQDYSRKLIEYMERDFENETLVDIFGLQDQSVIPPEVTNWIKFRRESNGTPVEITVLENIENYKAGTVFYLRDRIKLKNYSGSKYLIGSALIDGLIYKKCRWKYLPKAINYKYDENETLLFLDKALGGKRVWGS